MKLFTVDEERGISEGILVHARPWAHIPVGSLGRGRELVHFPVGKYDFPQFETTTLFTSVSKEIVWALVGSSSYTRSLFRKERFHSNEEERIWIEKHSSPRSLHEASCLKTQKGTVMFIYRRMGDTERAVVLASISAGWRGKCRWKESKGIRTLARGQHAQGSLGRLGKHDERLIVMDPGAEIQFERTGRIPDSQVHWALRWDKGELFFGQDLRRQG